MNLREALSKLGEWSGGATLFAERIDGEFRSESKAVVIELSDDELKRPIGEVAKTRAPGMHYLLEISIVRDVLEDWRSNHPDQEPLIGQLIEFVIHYAENDAYPESFFA